MDSISLDDDKIINNKKYLVVKIPANVENREKCIELLGGKEKINSKFVKNEDIELSLLLKKIPLEKCWTNDVLIKRKRMRNKTKYYDYIINHEIFRPGVFKYKYELVGKIDSIYDFFAMHDFISINPEKKKFDLDVIEKLIIDPEEIPSNPLKDFSKTNINQEIDDEEFYNNENEEENTQSNLNKKENARNEICQSIKNLINNKIETNSLKTDNIFLFLQPEKFSYGRNMYPHVFKELETTIKFKNHK